MISSIRDPGPKLGQALAGGSSPVDWTVERTGVGIVARPLPNPVWRVVRVRRSAAGWLVTVAAFRA